MDSRGFPGSEGIEPFGDYLKGLQRLTDPSEDEEIAIPDYTSKIAGFRSLTLYFYGKESEKKALVARGHWNYQWDLLETQEAECRVGWITESRIKDKHTSPNENCSCVFYSYKSVAPLPAHNFQFITSNWGKIIECDFGIRSQYSKIEAMIARQPEKHNSANNIKVIEAAKELRIPVVERSQAIEFAKDLGLVVFPFDSHEYYQKTGRYSSRHNFFNRRSR